MFIVIIEGPTETTTRNTIIENKQKCIPEFVAMVDIQVVGWGVLQPRNLVGFDHVADLAMILRPAYRGKGIGTKILSYLIDSAKKNGFERLQIQVFENTTNAVTFYRMFGFLIEGRKENDRKIGNTYFHTLLMALPLN